MNRVLGLAVALAMSTLAQAAAAQDRVYRCSAEGRSYSQQPCTNGASIEVADVRSAAQVTQAQRVAQRNARLADALVRQRQQVESAAARQGPILIGARSRVTHDAAACRGNSACARTERSKHDRRQQADRITLYRAPTT